MAAVGKSLSARILAQASARSGVGHWMLERTTSVALVPLTLWFIVSAVSLSGAGYEEVRAWLATPFNTVAMLLTVFAVFWHAQLGAHVIVEDYVHGEGAKVATLMAINFGTVAVGLACIVAVLKVALGS
ncbi:MAG: succinate dehydrogenase, hydrophobic membrane anchor protein [Geminicoccaceae bacterium]